MQADWHAERGNGVGQEVVHQIRAPKRPVGRAAQDLELLRPRFALLHDEVHDARRYEREAESDAHGEQEHRELLEVVLLVPGLRKWVDRHGHVSPSLQPRQPGVRQGSLESRRGVHAARVDEHHRVGPDVPVGRVCGPRTADDVVGPVASARAGRRQKLVAEALGDVEPPLRLLPESHGHFAILVPADGAVVILVQTDEDRLG
mmetsp:Transcript_55242/g.167929  ORF Transcript_55242/g.167929 Transcript_55242/m.167929 type:complete len:203 (-) Transcript_55242:232-840(-)